MVVLMTPHEALQPGGLLCVAGEQKADESICVLGCPEAQVAKGLQIYICCRVV